MAKMKDFLMNIEELAWDAVDSGANDDVEIYTYILNWLPVEFQTVKEIVRQMYLGDPEGKEGLT